MSAMRCCRLPTGRSVGCIMRRHFVEASSDVTVTANSWPSCSAGGRSAGETIRLLASLQLRRPSACSSKVFVLCPNFLFLSWPWLWSLHTPTNWCRWERFISAFILVWNFFLLLYCKKYHISPELIIFRRNFPLPEWYYCIANLLVCR